MYLPCQPCSADGWSSHYDNHDDVLEAGDAYYLAPGHVPEIEAGTEFVMFSPADELKATDAAMPAG